MSLTETKLIDQITVVEHGIVLYREATRIMRGSEVMAQTFHRTSLTPGQDLTGHPEKVVAIATAAWTPEVVAAYQTMLAEQAAKM
jgi:hypothetical protein